MTRAQVFPAVLILLDVAAAVVYALDADVLRQEVLPLKAEG